jgi:hypothetical protein
MYSVLITRHPWLSPLITPTSPGGHLSNDEEGSGHSKEIEGSDHQVTAVSSSLAIPGRASGDPESSCTGTDLTLAKRFAVTEKTSFQLRAAAFNVINHGNNSFTSVRQRLHVAKRGPAFEYGGFFHLLQGPFATTPFVLARFSPSGQSCLRFAATPANASRSLPQSHSVSYTTHFVASSTIMVEKAMFKLDAPTRGASRNKTNLDIGIQH